MIPVASRLTALAIGSLALLHCAAESPFQDDNAMPSEAAISSCPSNGGTEADVAVPDESHSAEELAACASRSECGGKTRIAYDEEPTVNAQSTKPTGSNAPSEERDADGWIFKWRGEATGWSVIGNGWANASIEGAVSKLENDCKTNEGADANNRKRCVLLRMERKSGGCWPYRTYSTKVKCMCNLNVNAVHPDE
ncbi:MAG: hypothetical protein U0169_11525 [Polyangiaceae bacterium]